MHLQSPHSAHAEPAERLEEILPPLVLIAYGVAVTSASGPGARQNLKAIEKPPSTGSSYACRCRLKMIKRKALWPEVVASAGEVKKQGAQRINHKVIIVF